MALGKMGEIMPTNCWFCGTEMIWGADFDFSDYGFEGNGIIATLHCPGCEASAEFKTKEQEETKY